MRRLGVAGASKLRTSQNGIRPSGSRTVCSGVSIGIPGRLRSTGLPNCSTTSGGGRDAEENPRNPGLRQRLKRIAEAVCRDSGPRAGSPCLAPGDKAGEPVPTVSRRRGLALARRQRCGREEGARTGGRAPGLRNRAGKLSERPGWPGADMAGRSVLRISDPGSHAVRVRAALTVCLCAGFLYAKGVPPRARPSAGWWLSAPIFRNTHNPDRRAPCRSIDGPPQE